VTRSPAPIVDSPAAPFPQPPTRWTGEALAVTGLAEGTVLARQRGADAVTTTDVLFAVLARYGTHADRALYESHLSREDLLEKLARLTAPGVPAGVPSARG
jgi:hypothetical protein